jgi:hypothetical protein
MNIIQCNECEQKWCHYPQRTTQKVEGEWWKKILIGKAKYLSKNCQQWLNGEMILIKTMNEKLIFFFWWDWGLNSGPCTCKSGAILLEPYLETILLWCLGEGVFQIICLGWFWSSILPISASQVARITGVSHWCLAGKWYFLILFWVCY